MALTLNDHKTAITKRIIASFSDDSRPKMGLSGFFPSETTQDRVVSIEVERNRQLIAVDVQRGADANMNTFNSYTEKLFSPPMYLEGFDFSSLDRYNVTFGEQNNPTKSQAFSMISEASDKLTRLKDKIDRAIELQRSQALQTGIVSIKTGQDINFNRKAESLKVLTGTDVWSDAASDPFKDLEEGCKFLRHEGLSAGSVVNVIYGRDAYLEFLNNQKIKDAADIRNMERINLGFPQFDNVTGLHFKGQLATSDFKINIWTYSDFYEMENGVKKNYIDEKNVVMIAEDFKAKTAYAGIPAIMRDKSNSEYPEYIQQMEAEFYMNNYVDYTKKSHMFDIASAPLAVPISVDRVYTLKVLA